MELLDVILEKTGMQYISDLGDALHIKVVVDALKSVYISDFDVCEWKEAIDYLTGGKITIQSIEDVQDLLNKL